jgi:hypothetical protein
MIILKNNQKDEGMKLMVMFFVFFGMKREYRFWLFY